MIAPDLQIMLHVLTALDPEPRPYTGRHNQILHEMEHIQASQAASEICHDCHDTGIREHESQRVVCWCEAGDL